MQSSDFESSYGETLAAHGRSHRTQETYPLMLRLFGRYLDTAYVGKALDAVVPEDLEAYQRYLVTERKVGFSPRPSWRRRPAAKVADILRDHAHGLHLTGPQARAVRDIVACRAERLGRHLEVCPDCGLSRGSYNSCRNRHCPKCQILKQELGAEAQEALLLPTSYFHIVFTIPRELHLPLQGPRGRERHQVPHRERAGVLRALPPARPPPALRPHPPLRDPRGRRRKDLDRCRALLGAPPAVRPQKDASWVVPFERLFGANPLRCPACKTGVLAATRVLPPMRR